MIMWTIRQSQNNLYCFAPFAIDINILPYLKNNNNIINPLSPKTDQPGFELGFDH